MGRAGDYKIKPFEGEEYTCITFIPDLAKFKMSILDKDTVALMTRRAYDIAGASKGVRVFFNGKKLPVSYRAVSHFLSHFLHFAFCHPPIYQLSLKLQVGFNLSSQISFIRFKLTSTNVKTASTNSIFNFEADLSFRLTFR